MRLVALVVATAHALTLPRRHHARAYHLTRPRAAAVPVEESVTELADRIAAAGAEDLGLLSHLEELRSMKFFSLYSIDMLANCAYLGGALEECDFDACEVLPEEPVPQAVLDRDTKAVSYTHLTLPTKA